jgi:FkbM family methyltransferase
MPIFDTAGKLWGHAPAPARNIYHRLPLPLRRVFNRALFPSERRVVTVQSGLLAGVRLEVSPRLESGLYLGTHEPDLQAAVPKIARPGMIAYNVGAHIGFFTLALSRLVGPTGRILAFEPDPRAWPRLQRNLALNDFSGNVQTFQLAMGERDGEAQFASAMTDMQGRFARLPYVLPDAPVVSVTCYKFDSFLAQGNPKPELVLMDVEHAEGLVLAGMQQTLAELRPALIIEMHGPEAIADSWAELRRHSYELLRLPQMRRAMKLEEVVPLGHYLALPEERAGAQGGRDAGSD